MDASLNPQQRLAVEHGAETLDSQPPLLVIAGAGSGKTSTLAHRVAHLVVRGADPQRLLLLTFSRRAAAEMERRAGEILLRVAAGARRQPPAIPWSGTFHSIAARLLRAYAARIGLDSSFGILDRGDAEDLLDIVRHDLGLASTRNRFPAKATCLAIYSRAVNGETPLADAIEQTFAWCAPHEAGLKRLFSGYVAAKQAQNVLDYDDLLLYWSYMLAEPALAREIGDRFDHVLIDEYQDTNRLQAAIVLAMKPDGMGVTVVGDDAQSIYSFRAATVRNILDFPQCFAPQARVIALERNYRSTQAILDASNAVMRLARERFTKELWTDRRQGSKPRLVVVADETEQARCVAERVLELHECGVSLKAQAVLFRSSSHSAPLELELARRGIPFVKYGGLKFLEAAHIKDVLSVLKWADNPRNRMAGLRAIRLLPGVGPATANGILDAIGAASDFASAIASADVPEPLAAEWKALAAVVLALRTETDAWPADVERVVRWYEPQLQRIYDNAFARQADLVQLRQIASTYRSRERFLTELSLDPPDVTSGPAGPPGRDDDYLILSTIHSAKGQEWKAVQILNVVDGCIPSDMATATTAEIEEERRLLYVAMTRAKDELDLIVPQRFFVRQQSAYGDRHVHASRSRFIPDDLVALFESCAWPLAAATAAEPAHRFDSTSPVDIASRVRGRWS